MNQTAITKYIKMDICSLNQGVTDANKAPYNRNKRTAIMGLFVVNCQKEIRR